MTLKISLNSKIYNKASEDRDLLFSVMIPISRKFYDSS
ncbi:MAG: hypothetical protein BWY93_00425 [Euryarchaeota archaeon ADurb.BinA087]|mgnify:FL=1|nr:MAG: hypothetical protein BWY93_00425 [Euryarchaeota archaeon ADurb.BinA087]